MPFIQLGTENDLQITIPVQLTTDWATSLRENCFVNIVEHDHSGGGRGRPLGGSALAIDSITGSRIRLASLEYLRSRNAANTGDIGLIRLNGDDEIEIGANVVSATIASANIGSIASDTLVSSTSVTSPLIDSTNVVADNLISNADTSVPVTAGSSATIIDLSQGESSFNASTVHYTILQGSTRQVGTLTIDAVAGTVSDRFIGVDLGVIFSVETTLEGVIQLVATNNSLIDVQINEIELRR